MTAIERTPHGRPIVFGSYRIPTHSLQRIAGLGFAALVLAGCMSATEQQLLAEGKSRSYIDGYEDGCETGQHVSGPHMGLDAFTQDLVRFQFEPGYAEGWNAGLGDCKAASV